jgi:hypothetical protein
VEISHDPQRSEQLHQGVVEGTRLTYSVEVSPQRWMPVRLIEGRIVKEIGTNLRSIQAEAIKRCCSVPPGATVGSEQLVERL